MEMDRIAFLKIVLHGVVVFFIMRKNAVIAGIRSRKEALWFISRQNSMKIPRHF